MLNPYEVLGVSSSDSISAIKKAYRQKCMETHPEGKNPNRELFEKVTAAWKLIQEVHAGESIRWGHKTLFTIKRRSV